MLYDYLKQTEGFLRDRSQRLLNTEDLVAYINRARRDLALRTQSIRRLPPVSGQILTIQVTAPGSGYTAPQVTISGPDFPSGAIPFPGGVQAIAVAQQIGGQISDVSLSFGGYGYFQPTATLSDPTGSGATLSCQVSPILTVNPFQEIYNFSDFPLDTFPGVKSVFAIFSGSIIFNNFRYMLLNYPWTQYQALLRSYPQQYYYVPTVICNTARELLARCTCTRFQMHFISGRRIACACRLTLRMMRILRLCPTRGRTLFRILPHT